ncbi:hypothetical protein C8A01DRAFT_37819 [Parachaetomium inaequale]|uniref:Rhodopsin domain-containing protein n=1 Tax=Parachaetomium inaequale TaxID=2588326 RepID=A0AAN6PE36_9PEZI|nr:hypothetical protein C8A01DRAFT_37819 [Parachaetomium inaequale]
MPLYSDPPPLHPFSEDKPTLLVCWWITSFCAVIIALRVVGRFIRTEKLFREDKTAALALVPLFLRMGCVHVILIYGTNNARLEGAGLSDDELHNKSIASGLVLLSRVFYAATLWILKYAILEFFRRLNVTWRRTYDLALMFIRGLLITSFAAVLISDLAECQPFSNYWQVLPDPGGQCRQGYAQLLTMAVCNVVTDLLLVLFPVPVILSSSMSAKRKFQLVLLFSLSLAPVIVTIYRVPNIIADNGSQQTRSLYASIELLFATAAANALVLGSFVRDRGVKKKRFKYDSIAAGSIDRSSASDSRRPTALRHWGSDEDLVRDLGLGVKPELRGGHPSSPTENRQYIPAPPVTMHHDDLNAWRFPGGHERPSLSRSDDLHAAGGKSTRSDSSATHRRVSFFDYGGLLDDQPPSTTTTTGNHHHHHHPRASSSLSSSDQSRASPTRVPEPAVPASGSGFRRGSAALLQDLGGFLAPPGSRPRLPKPRAAGRESGPSPVKQAKKEGSTCPPPQQRGGVGRQQEPQLMDVGGLLEPPGRGE